MFFYLLFSFLFGLAIGSFLNCLIYRLAQRKTILGRSFCPWCKKTIKAIDNIPIFSFIILGGRCRYCGKKISWQYPAVELATGLLFTLPLFNLQLTCLAGRQATYNLQLIFRDWIILATLVFIFVYDLRYQLVEDKVILPAAGAVFILNLVGGVVPLAKIILSLAIGVGFFGLQYFLTRGKGIGLGDLRIGLFMGAGLGWPSKLALAIFISYIIGALASGTLLALGKKKMADRIPLGPFLAIGTAVTIFFGEGIINWYLSIW